SLALDVNADPLRPIYHIASPANWMNDPHGAIFYDGFYHLFYQTNPYGNNWGFISWGHVVSQDGVYWEHRPLALVPVPDGYDEHGVFSGCCVMFPQDGSNPATCQPTIFYTGLRRSETPHRDVNLSEQSQLMATVDVSIAGSSDFPADRLASLDRWQKRTQPIITAQSHPHFQAGIDQSTDNLDCMRDPFVWQEADGNWYMLLGTALRRSKNSQHVEGNALLYQYQDDGWHCLGQFAQTSHGRNWECCNYLRLGQKTDEMEILIISPEYRKHDLGNPRAKEKKFVLWAAGSTKHALTQTPQPQEKGYFLPQPDAQMGERWHVLDHGGYDGFYAATTLQHEGKTILWGWSTGGGQPHTNWNGVLTLPRQLEWRDPALRMLPMPWIEDLRGALLYQNCNFILGGDQQEAHHLAAGDCVEIKAEIGLGDGDGVVFSMWGDVVKVGLHCQQRTMTIHDANHCYEAPLNRHIDLKHFVFRCFLDRSILEVFLDDVQVITRRVYPRDIHQQNIAVYAANSGDWVNVMGLKVWRMNSIWKNR
ncbi:MAG: glycoside hydrolase family 32 protein, partial [Cyanothece sp. SIO2G6]|nr:glycoside hydrolase family 32 protein [Cyanothece sp. SIO2G6]